ncbi:MAG: DinB family protein, partial [Dehalococcoidia bacterium]
LPEDVLDEAPEEDAGAGTWSIQVVAAHLVDSHRRQVGRLRRIITEERPEIPSVDEWESLEASGLLAEQTHVLVDTFAEERLTDLEWYASLDADALRRTGMHSVAGEVSAAEVLNHAAYHDSQHLGQIARLIEAFADRGRGNMRNAGP